MAESNIKIYGLVKGGKMENKIVADKKFCDENLVDKYDYIVDMTSKTGEIGWTYNPQTKEFTAPA